MLWPLPGDAKSRVVKGTQRMYTADFERLCAGFCERSKIHPPALQAQADGMLAFNIDWRGVMIDMLYEPVGSPGHAFVLFQLGPIEQGRHDPWRIQLALLQANFLSLQVNPPMFSCHPETGDAVLQCTVSLAQATDESLYKIFEEGIGLVLRWRQTYFLPDMADAPSHAPINRSTPHGFA